MGTALEGGEGGEIDAGVGIGAAKRLEEERSVISCSRVST